MAALIPFIFTYFLFVSPYIHAESRFTWLHVFATLAFFKNVVDDDDCVIDFTLNPLPNLFLLSVGSRAAEDNSGMWLRER